MVKLPNIWDAMKKSKVRKKVDKNIREYVWQKYNKNSLLGKCYVCKRPITHDNFDLGHDKAVAKGGSNIVSNLRPICRPCNSAMRTTSIEQYKAKILVEKNTSKKKK